MKVKNKLKRQLDSFLNAYPRNEEHGGFLLKNNRGVVSAFLPIPNIISDDQRRSKYQPPNNALSLAEKFGEAKRMRVEAFWHSHPTPCIMSTADLSATNYYINLVFVTITLMSEWGKREFIWYACRGIKPEKIECV